MAKEPGHHDLPSPLGEGPRARSPHLRPSLPRIFRRGPFTPRRSCPHRLYFVWDGWCSAPSTSAARATQRYREGAAPHASIGSPHHHRHRHCHIHSRLARSTDPAATCGMLGGSLHPANSPRPAGRGAGGDEARGQPLHPFCVTPSHVAPLAANRRMPDRPLHVRWHPLLRSCSGSSEPRSRLREVLRVSSKRSASG
jgi:hypothetical protein